MIFYNCKWQYKNQSQIYIQKYDCSDNIAYYTEPNHRFATGIIIIK